MGNQLLRKTKEQFKSSQYDWNTVSSTPYCTKVKDNRRNLSAEKYKVDYREFQRDVDCYLLRNQKPEFLVAVYDVFQDPNNSLCSVNHEISVVVEDIPYRLCDLGAISFQEGLYIMTCVLRACEILKSHKMPFILLEEGNICFNSAGQCKYWINEQLSGAKPILVRTVSEQAFVQSLWDTISQRINEVNSFFDPEALPFDDLTLVSMKNRVDRALVKSLVALPALAHLSQSPPSILPTKNSSGDSHREQKKLSLSSYIPPRGRKVVKGTKVKEGAKCQNRGRKVSLHREKTAIRMDCPPNIMGLKITKRNPSVFIEQTNPEPIPPFYSHVFVSPQKSPKHSLVSQSSVHKSWLGSPSPSRTAIGGTPKMNFSYQSPSQAKR